MSIIFHSVNDLPVGHRQSDGYINATEMCKSAGKQLKHYLENESTKAYLEALSGSVGIPTDLLVAMIRTGTNTQRGTWVHPQVAIHLAMWCSPEFAVQVTEWVVHWLTQGQQPILPQAAATPETTLEVEVTPVAQLPSAEFLEAERIRQREECALLSVPGSAPWKQSIATLQMLRGFRRWQG